MSISSPNHLLESSHQGDSNKRHDIAFGEEITQVESIEVNFTHLILDSVLLPPQMLITIIVHHIIKNLHAQKAKAVF